MSCSNVQIKYMGNGAQVLYTFPFEYMDETDVWVGLWNDNSNRWEEIHDWLDLNVQPDIIAPYYWTFDNPTTIRFLRNTNPTEGPASPVGPPANWAPPPPNNPTTEATGANILIQRRSDDNDLVEFYPGSSIRAQDLNYNFEQLLYLVQEGRCVVPQWFLNYLDTILITFERDSVTRPEQINGEAEISDEKFFTTAASAARHDTYHQDATPDTLPVEQPGKAWFDTSILETFIWDANAGAWVDMGNAGPPGPAGPPGSFIVSDTPPAVFPTGAPGVDRPLESGDAWFNSDNGNLFVWYIDANSSQWVNISKAGPRGADGQPGEDGSSNFTELTATAPILVTRSNANRAADISFDLNLINGLP